MVLSVVSECSEWFLVWCCEWFWCGFVSVVSGFCCVVMVL